MKRILLILLVLVSSYVSYAGVGLGLHFNVGIPQNEFRQNTDATGFGGNLDLLFDAMGQEIFSFGLNTSFQVYGFNRQDETLSAEIKVGNTVLDRIDIPLRVTTSNNIFGMHAMGRIKAPIPIVQPYLQGMFGFRHLYTVTKIFDQTDDRRFSSEDDNLISRKKQVGDYVLSYGYGGGLMAKLAPAISIDFSVTFLNGQEADYYDGEDTSKWEIEFTGNPTDIDNATGDDYNIDVLPRRSKTDMMMVNVGVFFSF